MKQIELELKKRLLIREFPIVEDLNTAFDAHKSLPDVETKLICKGSELTEEIARDFVKGMYSNAYISNTNISQLYQCDTASYIGSSKEAFIQQLKKTGFYWENPIEDELHCKDCYKYQPKTFNPEKTLIFEILL